MFQAFDVDRSRAPWWLVGILIGGAMAYILYSFIGTFVFALFFYYATRPIYKRLKHHVRSPSIAAAISIFTLALPFVLLIAYTVAIGLQELDAFLDNVDTANGSIDQYETLLQPYFDVSTVAQDPTTLLTDAKGLDLLQSVVIDSQQYVVFIGNMLLHLFVMAALAFYLLRDGTKLSRWFKSTFGDDRGVLEAYMRAVDRDFSSVFFGNILNAFFTGVIGAAAYSLMNVYAPTGLAIPYPALLGLLAGAASLVPVVGMKLVYFPVGAYMLFRAALADTTGVFVFPILFFAVSFLVVDVIPDLVLRPYVSGRNLHVGAVMFAYIFGPLLFGWYGIFLGPVLLVFGVHFARLVLPELLHSERLQPYAVDPTHFNPPDPDLASAATDGPAASDATDPVDATAPVDATTSDAAAENPDTHDDVDVTESVPTDHPPADETDETDP